MTRVAEIMTTRPIMVGPEEGPDAVRRLMEAARVRHLPVISGGSLMGLWTRTDAGAPLLLAADRAFETTPEVEAGMAVAALLGGREAVVVWPEQGGRPVGLLTRGDVLRMLRLALETGLARRRRHPLALLLVGPQGAGKTALALRAVDRLRTWEIVLVHANSGLGAAPDGVHSGVRVIDVPEAHWARGLEHALPALEDADLIVLEERHGSPDMTQRLGGGLQVLVMAAPDLQWLTADRLGQADALVITKLDLPHERAGFDAALAQLRGNRAGLPIFRVGPAAADTGLADWVAWLEASRRARPGGTAGA
jgi:Ni2+-binding GTPase involved in maturation of urease and hydrogenase